MDNIFGTVNDFLKLYYEQKFVHGIVDDNIIKEPELLLQLTQEQSIEFLKSLDGEQMHMYHEFINDVIRNGLEILPTNIEKPPRETIEKRPRRIFVQQQSQEKLPRFKRKLDDDIDYDILRPYIEKICRLEGNDTFINPADITPSEKRKSSHEKSLRSGLSSTPLNPLETIQETSLENMAALEDIDESVHQSKETVNERKPLEEVSSENIRKLTDSTSASSIPMETMRHVELQNDIGSILSLHRDSDKQSTPLSSRKQLEYIAPDTEIVDKFAEVLSDNLRDEDIFELPPPDDTWLSEFDEIFAKRRESLNESVNRRVYKPVVLNVERISENRYVDRPLLAPIPITDYSQYEYFPTFNCTDIIDELNEIMDIKIDVPIFQESESIESRRKVFNLGSIKKKRDIDKEIEQKRLDSMRNECELLPITVEEQSSVMSSFPLLPIGEENVTDKSHGKSLTDYEIQELLLMPPPPPFPTDLEVVEEIQNKMSFASQQDISINSKVQEGNVVSTTEIVETSDSGDPVSFERFQIQAITSTIIDWNERIKSATHERVTSTISKIPTRRAPRSKEVIHEREQNLSMGDIGINQEKDEFYRNKLKKWKKILLENVENDNFSDLPQYGTDSTNSMELGKEIDGIIQDITKYEFLSSETILPNNLSRKGAVKRIKTILELQTRNVISIDSTGTEINGIRLADNC